MVRPFVRCAGVGVLLILGACADANGERSDAVEANNALTPADESVYKCAGVSPTNPPDEDTPTFKLEMTVQLNRKTLRMTANGVRTNITGKGEESPWPFSYDGYAFVSTTPEAVSYRLGASWSDVASAAELRNLPNGDVEAGSSEGQPRLSFPDFVPCQAQ